MQEGNPMRGWSDNTTVIGVRSLIFHLVCGLVTLVFLLLYPVILLPRRFLWGVLRQYIRLQLLLLRMICGQRYRVIGAENAPSGPCIVAARHEAMWETFLLPLIFDNPAVVLKTEIMGYPIAGRLSRKLGFIGVDRSGAPEKVKKSFDAARRVARAGRSVLIFPSGTRNPARRHRVQGGVTVLYRLLKLPCLPVVLDSGDFWIYGRWLRRPGVITVRILEPIPTGLRASEFQARLEADLAQPA
jgi:1-acyl-sn-glycerol-3-phosphate acyltransferase